MCAVYGIRVREPESADLEASAPARPSRVRFRPAEELGVAPHDDPSAERRFADWAAMRDGTARITGRKACNLNPVIVAADHAVHATRPWPGSAAPGVPRSLALGWWWLHVGGAAAPYSAFNSRDDRLVRS